VHGAGEERTEYPAEQALFRGEGEGGRCGGGGGGECESERKRARKNGRGEKEIAESHMFSHISRP
jgi:hypothetical protein